MLRGASETDIQTLLVDVLPNGRGFVVMMKAYLDRGVKDDVASVAAMVFKSTRYGKFVKPWNKILRKWDATAFHAADFYPGAGEFKRDTPEREKLFGKDSKTIPGLIGRHIEHALSVSFSVTEFERTVPPQWIAKFGKSTHSLSVQLCLLYMGFWVQAMKSSSRFAYFMESGDEDESEIVDTVRRMKEHPTASAHIRVTSFTPIDKGVARGLEAADFFAWHRNKHHIDKERTGKSDEPRKDFEAFVDAADGKVHEIFVTGDKLKYFLEMTWMVKGVGELGGDIGREGLIV